METRNLEAKKPKEVPKIERAFWTLLILAGFLPGNMAAVHGLLDQYLVAAPRPVERPVNQTGIPPRPELFDQRELPQTQEQNEILNLPPNFDLPAVNFSIIPWNHWTNEHVIMAINFGDLEIGSGQFSYGEGVRKAISRHQDTTLVLEQPPKDQLVTVDQWRAYVREVVKLYKPTTFIIGNEVNAPSSHPQSLSVAEYVKLYQIAYEEIKQVSPQTRVFLYGEAYSNKGEYLSMVLKNLREKNIPFDGLAVHFYDVAGKLSARMALYQEILQKNEFAGKPIKISELGLPGIKLTSAQRMTEMIKLLATAEQLLEKGQIEEACWFAAFSHSAPANSLYRLSNGKLVPNPEASAFLMATRFLKERVTFETSRGITTIRGEATGRPAKIVWSNSGKRVVYPLSEGVSAYDIQGNRLDSEEKRLIPLTGFPVFIY